MPPASTTEACSISPVVSMTYDSLPSKLEGRLTPSAAAAPGPTTICAVSGSGLPMVKFTPGHAFASCSWSSEAAYLSVAVASAASEMYGGRNETPSVAGTIALNKRGVIIIFSSRRRRPHDAKRLRGRTCTKPTPEKKIYPYSLRASISVLHSAVAVERCNVSFACGNSTCSSSTTLCS